MHYPKSEQVQILSPHCVKASHPAPAGTHLQSNLKIILLFDLFKLIVCNFKYTEDLKCCCVNARDFEWDLKSGTNGRHFVINYLKSGKKCLNFDRSCFKIVGTPAKAKA